MQETKLTTKPKVLDLSSAALHILAMALMLCDHLWATVVTGNEWMTSIGRIAFPLFAFLLVEGYFHTRDLRRYVRRLLLFAILSEIPFDLMCSSSVLDPFHQNVLWTFLLGIGMIHLNEWARKSGSLWRRVVTAAGTVCVGYAAGTLAMVDYFGEGVLTVLVFYFFRERKWWCLLAQVAALYYIHAEMLGGLYFDVTLFGHTFPIVEQGLALLALIPIWLYRGRQGCHSRWFRRLCYGFYPAHMLLLYFIMSAMRAVG